MDAFGSLESAEQYATRTGQDLEQVRSNYTVSHDAAAK
jgi:hypothetical protein